MRVVNAGATNGRIELVIDRGLKSGRLDIIEMSEDEAISRAAELLKIVMILRHAKRSP